MKLTIIPLAISLLAGLPGKGCSAKSESGLMLFTFTDVTYQTWAVSETNKGTDLIIYLSDVDPDVKFTSITFRGVEVPVSVDRSGDKAILRAQLITGESVIDNYEYRVSGEEDNLKYSYGSKEYTYPVKKFRRLPARIKQQ